MNNRLPTSKQRSFFRTLWDFPHPPDHFHVYTDGSIRPDRQCSAVAAIVQDKHGQILHWWARRIGPMTNNEAEYAAVIYALENLLRMRPLEIDVFTDSRLIVDQMHGLATTRAPGLQKAFQHLRSLIFEFNRVSFHHIPRERNRLADALANDVVDHYLPGVIQDGS